jgi:arachidonate 15-lipoxygenase
MAVSPTIRASAAGVARRSGRLERARGRYVYRNLDENYLSPIAAGKKWPFFEEQYGPSWLLRFGPGVVTSWLRKRRKLAKYDLQRLLFRFDKMGAYDDLLSGADPDFLDHVREDAAFGHWRTAGPNALSLVQQGNLTELRSRVPLNIDRIEARINQRLGQNSSLALRAAQGNLFVVDFKLLQQSLRPETARVGPPEARRDSRWRTKYLPAPIGVFLEAPTFYSSRALVPLAIQIDQKYDDRENPVYYPGDGWAWEIAKAYFEVADLNIHVGTGHVYRTHLAMEPFAMATPRQLSEDHPVFVLLRPHLRYTLRVNRAAYEYFGNRRNTYADFYAGTLDETRQIAKESYLAVAFRDFGLEADLSARSVAEKPADYPYRDDARRWLAPIRDFVSDYMAAFYDSDADILADEELQAWALELIDPERGAVRGLVPGDTLDTRGKLIALLAQVIFIAGPGHASQHYSSNYFYRHPPSFPGAAYVPPVWVPDRLHEARYQNMFPPIRTAARQVMFNTFTNFKYDRFGDYGRYRLGEVPEAVGPIQRLRAALDVVEVEIVAANQTRMLPYDFLLPSRVPNSVNI